jgi:hypothetical protein
VQLANRLLFVTFVESVGTILLERGIYFYTHERLFYGERENLLLAFAFGVFYVAGALASHRAAQRFGEKRLLLATLCGLLAAHTVLILHPSGAVIPAVFVTLALLHGLKWPVVESFYSAGQTPDRLLFALGRFNVCWALAVPIGVAGSGPLISARPELLFVAAALLNVAALSLSAPLPARPLHLEAEHPERPAPATLALYARLLVAARWSLLLSYTLMFLLAPLMPQIFADLGLEVRGATLSAAALDGVRVASFAVLGAWAGWQARRAPLVLASVLTPAGFALIIWGKGLAAVLAGELLFGVAAGVAYTAALYYALVVRNAAVDAGGAHEGLIGTGFAIGPLCGLAGTYLHGRGLAPDAATAIVVAVAPVVIVCSLGALLPLRKAQKR